MNASALITLVTTWVVVIGFTAYFFVKVLVGSSKDADNRPE